MLRVTVVGLVLCVLSFLNLNASAAVHLPRKGRIPILADGRIVGGTNSSIAEVPWQLSLVYWDIHRCGATVVRADIAITAAHCLENVNVDKLQVRAGSSTRYTGGTLVNIERYVMHPDFNRFTLNYDLAILFLATPLVFSEGIAPIRLAQADTVLSVGETALISGWGTMSEGGTPPSSLQSVKLPIYAHDQCQQLYEDFSAVTDSMICAGMPDGGRDACQGDSGGPMVYDDHLVGVVSWGFGCARPNYPGIFAKVSVMREWIDNVIVPFANLH